MALATVLRRCISNRKQLGTKCENNILHSLEILLGRSSHEMWTQCAGTCSRHCRRTAVLLDEFQCDDDHDVMIMMMMMMMVMVTMTIEIVEQRPGWSEHVFTTKNWDG